MDLGCTVLLLDSEKAEEIYTYTYPSKDVGLGKDVHSSALLLLGMKDLIFQVTNNEIYLASFNGLRALYAIAGPHFVLVLVHSPNAPFQFLHPNFARDLVRCVEFQVGPNWAAQVDASTEMQRTLDSIFDAGISRFVIQGTNYTWVEVMGGGVSEGVFMGEASEAQLCEAVANMEVGCTTKQHLVCVDIEGIGVIGTCVFSGTQQIYTTLNSSSARQVWEWLCVQHNTPSFQQPVTSPSIVMPTPSALTNPPTPSTLLSPPPTITTFSTLSSSTTPAAIPTSTSSSSVNNSSPASSPRTVLERASTHTEWQKITQVYPVKPASPPRYPHTYTLAALGQEEFVVCVLIQSVGTNGWSGNDLRGAIVLDEMRGLLHSLRAAGTLARIRKQLTAQTPQMYPTDLPYLVTTSPDITLFHFVAHNQITGVVVHHIAPNTLTISAAAASTPTVTPPLEVLFTKTCDKIRKTMISNGAHEHGVRVSLGDEQYWVVGRTSLQGTFFVCYSAQSPQSVVEMAFKAQFFSNLHL